MRSSPARAGCSTPIPISKRASAPFSLIVRRRRALLKKVMLVSSNRRCTGFVVPSAGLASVPISPVLTSIKEEGEGENPKIRSESPSASTDFILLPDEGMGAPPLYSNNKKTSDFVLSSGLCSAMLTNMDVLWMERVAQVMMTASTLRLPPSATDCHWLIWMEHGAQVPPGTLFKAFHGLDTSASKTEVSWEPMARWHALAKSLRMPRGHKSYEHLEQLRKSDPLINLSAWIDWSKLRLSIEQTRAYQTNQKALTARASRRSLQSSANGAASVAVAVKAASPLKARRPQSARDERSSSDSVMVLDPYGEVDRRSRSTDEDEGDSAEESVAPSPVSVEAKLQSRRYEDAGKSHPGKMARKAMFGKTAGYGETRATARGKYKSSEATWPREELKGTTCMHEELTTPLFKLPRVFGEPSTR